MKADGERVSFEERAARGKAARAAVPRASHADWRVLPTRVSPIDLLEEQATTRVPELVPIRHGRMLLSPFSYFRGAALPMAADLAATPALGAPGAGVRRCASLELRDVRLAGASSLLRRQRLRRDGARSVGVGREAAGREPRDRGPRARVLGEAAPEHRAELGARVPRGDARLRRSIDARGLVRAPRHGRLVAALPLRCSIPKRTPSVWNAITKARAHDSHQAFEKLCRVVDGEPRIRARPAARRSGRPLPSAASTREIVTSALDEILKSYRRTLDPDRRRLLEQYRLVHVARKVVGVGSVGTEAWIALLLDRADGSPLLPPGEAGRSVGARTVHGQEWVLEPRSARRCRPTAHAGGERHLPGLGAVRPGRRANATTTSASSATGRARPTSPA